MLLLSPEARRVACDCAGIKTKSPAFRSWSPPDTDASMGPETFNKKYGHDDGASVNASARDTFRSYTFTGFCWNNAFAFDAAIGMQSRCCIAACRTSITIHLMVDPSALQTLCVVGRSSYGRYTNITQVYLRDDRRFARGLDHQRCLCQEHDHRRCAMDVQARGVRAMDHQV